MALDGLDLDLDFVETLERMVMSDQLADRLQALEKRIPAIDACERRLEIMQQVQNNLTLELDAAKFGSGGGGEGDASNALCLAALSGDVVSRAELEEELRRRDAKMRLEFKDAMRNMYKKLMFCSDSEASEDESGGGTYREAAASTATRLEYRYASGGSCSLSGPNCSSSSMASAVSSESKIFSYSAVASGAIPKRPTVQKKVDKAMQTMDTAESFSQANISEDEIYQFVTGTFRKKVAGIVEETARGRMSNTIHHHIDLVLKEMVEESIKKNASEKTIAQFLDMMKDTLERFLAGELKEMMQKELEELKPKIMDELDEIIREKYCCPYTEDDGCDANMDCWETSSLNSDGNLSKEPSGSSELSNGAIEIWNKEDEKRERKLSADAEEFKPCSRRSNSVYGVDVSSRWPPTLSVNYQSLPLPPPPVAFGLPPPAPAPTSKYVAPPFKVFWPLRN